MYDPTSMKPSRKKQRIRYVRTTLRSDTGPTTLKPPNTPNASDVPLCTTPSLPSPSILHNLPGPPVSDNQIGCSVGNTARWACWCDVSNANRGSTQPILQISPLSRLSKKRHGFLSPSLECQTNGAAIQLVSVRHRTMTVVTAPTEHAMRPMLLPSP